MRFVLFVHSLVSDWNHGNAHFLRGVVRDLQRRGHEVRVYEPAGGWSRGNLVADAGPEAEQAFAASFPDLTSRSYPADGPFEPVLDEALEGADVVLVHEWNDKRLVSAIGRRRAAGGRFTLLFHDTHHRTVSEPDAIRAFDLDAYDGVLAFGDTVRAIYATHGWGSRAHTWHEAADTSVFRPRPGTERRGDLVWIGNWGDDERSEELRRFLLDPVARLGLAATIHGVRYPEPALEAVRRAGIRYGGYLPNHRAPEVFAAHAVTVHVPRRFYTTHLPGIPTIRVFEALACGIPLVSAPWRDSEGCSASAPTS
ncbi:CgeB family protein [Azospirillum thermophilum]|uniref:CgeB family protein n=1 Tax=Azospirillum thermophilum TaxID=2202148 RepID=UPI001FE8EAE3|nr:glycosyltransferase [Azospirillum thermophilum]